MHSAKNVLFCEADTKDMWYSLRGPFLNVLRIFGGGGTQKEYGKRCAYVFAESKHMTPTLSSQVSATFQLMMP